MYYISPFGDSDRAEYVCNKRLKLGLEASTQVNNSLITTLPAQCTSEHPLIRFFRHKTHTPTLSLTCF